jgi:hypothetical protein
MLQPILCCFKYRNALVRCRVNASPDINPDAVVVFLGILLALECLCAGHLIGNGEQQVFVPTLKLTAMSQAISPQIRRPRYLAKDRLSARRGA